MWNWTTLVLKHQDTEADAAEQLIVVYGCYGSVISISGLILFDFHTKPWFQLGFESLKQLTSRTLIPSVLWRSWLGGTKVIRPVINLVGGCGGGGAVSPDGSRTVGTSADIPEQKPLHDCWLVTCGTTDDFLYHRLRNVYPFRDHQGCISFQRPPRMYILSETTKDENQTLNAGTTQVHATAIVH